LGESFDSYFEKQVDQYQRFWKPPATMAHTKNPSQNTEYFQCAYYFNKTYCRAKKNQNYQRISKKKKVLTLLMGAPKLPNPIIDIKAPNHPQISQDDPMPAAAAAADARGDISTIVGMSLEKAQEKGSDQLQRQSPKVTGSVSTSPLLSSFDKFSFSGFYEVVLVVIFMKNKQMRITGTIPGRNQKRMSETRLRANSD